MNEQFINDLSKELAKLGTIHSVGEEWISYTGKIPSGGIPYCGQEITRETYSALWSWAQAQGLVKTESEWQSIASSQNGNVPFYSSGNGTTTFRMPKLVGYVKGASSKAESGSYVAEGLPNIVGTVFYDATYERLPGNALGAFYNSSRSSNKNISRENSSGTSADDVSFDASRSNAIYGNSSHVTPETSVVLFGVYAFGTVSNPNDLNVSNLAAEVDSIKTSYLPLSGGTMTGTVKFAVNSAIVRSTNDAVLNIFGGSAYQKGAQLSLFGESQADLPSGFRLIAYDGTTAKQLQGTKSGALTWGGKNVVRSVNGVNADPSGNVAIQLGGSLSLVTSGTWTTIDKTTNFTVTGVTPNKPLYVVVKPQAYKQANVGAISGVLDPIGNVLTSKDDQSHANFIKVNHSDGRAGTMLCIPTATSITLQYYIGGNTPYYIYQ